MSTNTAANTLHVTINDPDDPMGMPLYDGPLNKAHDRIVPGEYVAVAMTDDDDSMTGTVTILERGYATFSYPRATPKD